MRRPIAVVLAGAATAFVVGCTTPGPAGEVLLPGIAIEQDTGTVRVDGEFCLDEGILEYLAVADGGKEYESVFALHCRPSHLHVAMLIAGYQEGEIDSELRGDFSPEADPAADIPPEGAPEVTKPASEHWQRSTGQPSHVTIEVDVQQPDGDWRRRPVEYFLTDRATGNPPPRLTWAFTGSFFHRDEDSRLEYFTADIEKSLIAMWYDPTALLNLAHDVGNPYRTGDAGLEVNADHLPKKGTTVRLILQSLSRAE